MQMLPLRLAKIMQQTLDNETLLLDSQGDTVHVLNSTAFAIWELCDGKHTVEQMEAAIADQFELPSDHTLSQDIRQTLNLFLEKGLLA